ncbi:MULTISPECIES: FAD-binding domain-containing protein [unclassified Cyanobium]|uniref:FAD-binding domain-containing protein n=1 Tax=unclassified Cyanobium TaxID=2627006 RepID=UPI0020CC74DF|nr:MULTISPECIES: FAD-binding domain-containing protein [unclassified Cyanobium]MCP9834075.1 deoxyribodipyrimidine photo-lyase [Cyanobium sp. La Preciosa 7G6]MCP9936838.1 deoxyribodipyrimidine photo-lyase [Cyanobium sp. Aljojuca 7A6]
MAPERWLFWHRRDLRLADNLGLAAAAAATPAVTGVFVLDPAGLAGPLMAPARVWFLCESLRELADRWQAAGSRLLILKGRPADLIPLAARAVDASVVTWNREVEPYGRERDRQVAAALQGQGTRVLVDWDQLLVAPEAISTGAGEPYRVYGPFLRNWRGQVQGRAESLEPVAAPAGLLDLDPAALPAERAALWAALPRLEAPPTAEALGYSFAGVDLCPCRPGEAAALAQLQAFADGGVNGGPMAAYEPGRNRPGEAGTSGLSAALSFGSLSPRQAWAAAQGARALARSEEALTSIGVWEQELAWREFYQQALFHFPELADGPYRPQWRHFPWENDPARFQAWCQGLTGLPIIDAAMRQLNESGWMHNRCRMVVASFLVKDLIVDWRWGERAFMERLVDGDLAANNGGWQWSASSGMDPKPLRIFNPFTQASKFDPEATYIRRWLPELAHVATADLLSGEIAPLERRGYPAPIVSHKVQQARFKALHAALPRG